MDNNLFRSYRKLADHFPFQVVAVKCGNEAIIMGADAELVAKQLDLHLHISRDIYGNVQEVSCSFPLDKGEEYIEKLLSTCGELMYILDPKMADELL